jgi:GT2 family glycosyltransferase
LIAQENIHSLQETTSTSVSVVIPVLNQSNYTESILNNISENSEIPQQIIIINNGSNDETIDVINRFKHLPIRLLTLRKNVGVNVAWNIGIKLCKSDYISVLNNDLVINKNFFKIIRKTFEANPNCGMLCPRTYRNPDYIKNVNEECFSSVSKVSQVKWRNGWAFTIKQELVDSIKIPKVLFNYCGDDFHYFMVKKLGYDILMMEQNIIFHYEGRTSRPTLYYNKMYEDTQRWKQIKEKLGL